MEKTNNKFLVGMSLLIAITVVLQSLSLMLIKIAGFGFNLVLIPIIIACIFYGVKGGTIVGGTFGFTAFVHCLLGWDTFGAFFFAANWSLTLLLTFGRGLFVGFVIGVLYKVISKSYKKRVVPTIIVSLTAPILNTGVFVILANYLFYDLVKAWAIDANAANVTKYLLGIVALNFAFEIISTVILCTPIVEALKKVKQRI